MFMIVFSCKKITWARQARYCIRDERLLVKGSTLLLKPIIVARQVGYCIKDKRLQVEESIFCFKEYHCSKPGKTLHEGREVIGSGQYSAIKKSLWQGRQDTA